MSDGAATPNRPKVSVLHAMEILREDPAHTVILLDIDGCLAALVPNPAEGQLLPHMREVLAQLERGYLMVACVTGRQSRDASDLVGLPSLAYVGYHGGEVLWPGSDEPDVDPEFGAWREAVSRFADGEYSPELRALGVRLDDKGGGIAAFHFRDVLDRRRAEELLVDVARRAGGAGLRAVVGEGIVEIRPDVPISKREGVLKLCDRPGIDIVAFAGDSGPDMDGYAALDELQADHRVRGALRIAVRGVHSPQELIGAADVVLDGPEELRSFLGFLALAVAPPQRSVSDAGLFAP